MSQSEPNATHQAKDFSEELRVERSGNGVVTLTLNRPHVKNALTSEMWEPLRQIFHEVRETSSDRVLVITGAAGVDTITGAAGADTISGGGGNDIVTYTSQNESNSTAYDVLSSLTFNSATAATINTELTIAAVNTAVATGSVSAGSLVADLNTLLAVGGGVGFDTAVGGDISAALITANAGDLSGKTFLAIDADADDAFTSADYLMDVTGTTLTTVDTSTFV